MASKKFHVNYSLLLAVVLVAAALLISISLQGSYQADSSKKEEIYPDGDGHDSETSSSGKEDHEEAAGGHEEASTPDVEFVLSTILTEKGFAFEGKDGQRNPVLKVKVGDVVKITLIKEDMDGIEHDLAIVGIDAHISGHVKERGESAYLIFKAEKPGEYKYICTIPGHREAGMEGLLIIEE